ncbi:uncharacterized protein N7511_006633 [Penicillium nucicola]|uniref:uncharacterized protein n=1 Tax=Penicillium nucicola TaxID=1850975 RepID=UPI002545246B|nr:uncharacterized protein N7511_006633 [Penicillium nucicola]KAJ5757939.1 hypothetical protein N7511_006633 [Penicillium nucicola]
MPQKSSDAEDGLISTESYETPPTSKRRRISKSELEELTNQPSRASIGNAPPGEDNRQNKTQETHSIPTDETSISKDTSVEEADDEWLSTDDDSSPLHAMPKKFASSTVMYQERTTEEDVDDRTSHGELENSGHTKIRGNPSSAKQPKKTRRANVDITHVNYESIEKNKESYVPTEIHASTHQAKVKNRASPKSLKSPARPLEEEVVNQLSHASLEPISTEKVTRTCGTTKLKPGKGNEDVRTTDDALLGHLGGHTNERHGHEVTGWTVVNKS